MALSQISRICLSNKTLHIIFTTGAVMVAFIALFHLKGVFYPTPGSPAWRHALFVVISMLVIYGLLKRPNWFFWLVISLTLQQWYSHGTYAYTVWKNEQNVDWISVAIILLLPVLLIFLQMDKNNKNRQ